jgi:hypothetical protein
MIGPIFRAMRRSSRSKPVRDRRNVSATIWSISGLHFKHLASEAGA